MTAGQPTVVVTKPIDFNKRVRLENQIPSYNPTRVGMKGPESKKENVSEYQGAYKKWPFQRPPASIRPEKRRMEIRVGMESSTTYKKDFVRYQVHKKNNQKDDLKKKDKEELNPTGMPKAEMYTKTIYNQDFVKKKLDKTESFKPKYEYNMSKTKFKGQTIYQGSYKEYDKDMAIKCRPVAIKPQENLEVPKKDVQFESKTTAKDDFQKPENPETPKPIIPKERKHIADVPMETSTIYQQYYTDKKMPQEFWIHNPKIQKPAAFQVSQAPFNGITTFMADFQPHYNVSRQECFKPVESDQQFTDAPFEGQTTQMMAYKAWPVSPPQKPVWAIKRPYKRPTQEIPLNSTYMMDFSDPGVIHPIYPVKPKEGEEDIIKHGAGDGKSDGLTVYQSNFKDWKGSPPAKSFLVKQVYVPPKSAIMCQSTQRSHYKGEQPVIRSELCRKTSGHRELNTDTRMYFNTTYRDTYTDQRPKSCPSSLQTRRVCKCAHCNCQEKQETASTKELESTKDSGISTSCSCKGRKC